MIRGLAVFLTHVVLFPILGTWALLGHKLRPQSDHLMKTGAVWARCIMWVGGTRLKIKNPGIPDANRPAVIVANHTSNMEVFALMATLAAPARYAAKAALFKLPFLGRCLDAAGTVPIPVSLSRAELPHIERLGKALEESALVIYFPEGERNPAGELGAFKLGAFATAIAYQVPIIPLAIHGGFAIDPRGSHRIRAGTLTLEYLDPIPTTGLDQNDRRTLRDKARATIEAALSRAQHDR